MAKLNRSHKSKELKDHIVAETKATFQSETGKNTEYDIKQGEVHSSTVLEDDKGVGKAVVIRQYQYELPKNLPQPSKAQLLLIHKPRIQDQLWLDELELILEPKVVFSDKYPHKFRIFATCQPKKGSLVYDRPNTLTEIAHGHAGLDTN